jgi:low temperature requirement protein LtrA
LPSILRKQGDPEPPSFLELFFDLVYIFTFRRLAHELDQSFTVVGGLRTAVLLLAAWWIWELMVWLTDLFDPRRPQVQLLIILAMFGSLVMALVVPGAFGDDGWIFVAAYLGIVFTRSAVLIAATQGHESQARSVRVAFWFGLTTVPWVAGALVPDGSVRLGLWAAAVATDYTAASIGWITPGFGRTNLESRIFTGVHVSERHRQIFIIALGEVILSNGLKFTSSRFESSQWAALVAAFAAVVLLFLIYARQSRRLLAPPALWSMDRVGPGIVTAYSHLVMVAGVVTLSASDAYVARGPVSDLRRAEVLAIVAGPALVLFGTGLFERAVTGQILWSRPIAIVILLGVAPWVAPLPALVPAIGADLVLVATFVSDITRKQKRTRSRSRQGSFP